MFFEIENRENTAPSDSSGATNKNMKTKEIKKRIKNFNERDKKRLYWLFVFLTLAIFILSDKNPLFSPNPESKKLESKKEEINLSLYKEATFSDSFSGDGWIDMEKTTLEFSKELSAFIYPQEEIILGSVVENAVNQKQTKQIVSRKINFNVTQIVAGQITRVDEEKVNSKIKYYFSNDGGINWITVGPGQNAYFQNSGNELKWKAEVVPIDEKQNVSSQIQAIYIKYWYAR